MNQEQLSKQQVLQLLGELLADLNAAGEAIVNRRVAAQGLDPHGVAWLLSQACLSIAVAAHFNAGRSLDELLAQVREAWKENEALRARQMQGSP